MDPDLKAFLDKYVAVHPDATDDELRNAGRFFLSQRGMSSPQPLPTRTGNSGLAATVIDQLAQGLTFHQARKLVAALEALGHGSYAQHLADIDASLAAQRTENPGTSAVSEMAGAALSPATRLLAGVYKGLAPATALTRALAGGATAGLGGAAYGAAAAQPGHTAHDALLSGALSALTGGVASAPAGRLTRGLVGAGVGAGVGGAIGETVGHERGSALLGGIVGGLAGLHEPISDADRAQGVLNILPPDADTHMAEIEQLAPGGSSLAGAAPRPDKPYVSRLWRQIKGVGADPESGALAEQSAAARIRSLMSGRKAVGRQMNVVAGPIPVDQELKDVLDAVRPALKGETPQPVGEAPDDLADQLVAMGVPADKASAAAEAQGGSRTVDAEDLADALSTLNFKLRQAGKQGVDAQGVRKYTLQKAHDALEGYLTERHPELGDLQRQYAMLSDEVRRLGNKGVLTKIADSRENYLANQLYGKGAASVGGSISVGHAVYSPRTLALGSLARMFRPDESRAGAKFAARYLLSPSMTPDVLRHLVNLTPAAPSTGVTAGVAAAPLQSLLSNFLY